MGSEDPDYDAGRGRNTVLFGLLGAGFVILIFGAAAAAGVVPFDLDSDDDDDGLPDSREQMLGTDPEEPDTDGDLLKDAWEVDNRTPGGAALPGSDPLHKDLYVQFNYGDRIRRLSPAERSQLRWEWANMPIDNPDGQQGIDVHVFDDPPLGGGLNRTVVVTGTRSRREVAKQFYSAKHLGERRCVYHQVVLGVFEDGTTVGYGDTPGYVSLVDGTGLLEQGGNVTIRNRYVMHELLHNVVGKFDDGSYHTVNGWLSHRALNIGQNEYVANKTAAYLSEHGYARSKYYSKMCG